MNNKHKIPETVKTLLQNPEFVLWCYNPTEESTGWWMKWLEEHPEREKDLVDARAILLATELNSIPFPEKDSDQLYARIQVSAESNRRKRKQRRLLYSVAAACVACLVIPGLWFFTQFAAEEAIFVPVGNVMPIAQTQTEIELELGNEKLLLANKASIKQENDGSVIVKEEEITDTTEKVDQQETENTTNINMNILRVPRGRYTDIQLADGSRVWVNSETVLQFPEVFAEDHRTIYADGEIYLEVAKDASRPFYVKTSQMNIRVLGTSFNITAYNSDDNQSVVLKEGSVEVITSNGLRQEMLPNDRLLLEDNEISVSKVDPYYYTSWIDGVFLFDKEPLRNIALRLSRHYRMNFVCSPEVENYKCTGKLVLFDDVKRVLLTLEEGLNVTTETNEDTIIINLKK